MTDGDDNAPFIADSSVIGPVVLGVIYDDTTGDEPETIDDWKARDVENSFIAWANQWLNGGPLEDFDRFVLTANLALLNRRIA